MDVPISALWTKHHKASKTFNPWGKSMLTYCLTFPGWPWFALEKYCKNGCLPTVQHTQSCKIKAIIEDNEKDSEATEIDIITKHILLQFTCSIQKDYSKVKLIWLSREESWAVPCCPGLKEAQMTWIWLNQYWDFAERYKAVYEEYRLEVWYAVDSSIGMSEYY